MVGIIGRQKPNKRLTESREGTEIQVDQFLTENKKQAESLGCVLGKAKSGKHIRWTGH